MDDDTAARARSATGQPLRPATMQDLQPLAEVYYHSLRSDEWIPAKVSTAPSPDEPGMVKLDCKSRARIDRVYVQVAVTASDVAPPVPEEPPAIGGVSAPGDAEMAAEASVDFDCVQCKAYVDAVLPWLQGAVSEASAQAWRWAQQGAASGIVSEPGPGGAAIGACGNSVSAMGGLAGVAHDAGVGALACVFQRQRSCHHACFRAGPKLLSPRIGPITKDRSYLSSAVVLAIARRRT